MDSMVNIIAAEQGRRVLYNEKSDTRGSELKRES